MYDAIIFRKAHLNACFSCLLKSDEAGDCALKLDYMEGKNIEGSVVDVEAEERRGWGCFKKESDDAMRGSQTKVPSLLVLRM